MILALLIAPVSTAASGNTSWMLNTIGQRRIRLATQPVSPSVSGGDIAITAPGRRNQPPTRRHCTPARSEYAAKPSALRRRFDLSRPGNGWTRVIVPHSVASDLTRRPPHPGSIWCDRYQGSAVTTWTV